ncbi:MAG: sulfotransferase [Aestuariibacter sp.]|nr:sulfotransferase [Aestuariibacter sp.]
MHNIRQDLSHRSPTDPSPVTSVLVYIVCGGRRTGTTLLSAILSSDERANPLGQEAQVLTRIVEAYRWGRENFEQFGQSFFGDPKTYRAFFAKIAARFAQEVSARISPGGVLVLKNPELSKVLLDVADLFPNARFLALVRDPRDQIASELEVKARQLAASARNPDSKTRNMDSLANQYAAYYPAPSRLEVWARRLVASIRDLVNKRRNIIDLARYYISYYPEILELGKQQPERINIIRYEDLVLRPDETLLDLQAATGLDLTFDPAKPWSRISPLARLHSTPSRSDLYGAPIDSRSVGRFRRDLSAEQAVAVEKFCADFMDKFDYQRSI